ncbi:MAG: hypothetical protein U5L46_13000 [Agrobacterium sp.]|nr:hypothetical protein [Agrobacterium sp.]
MMKLFFSGDHIEAKFDKRTELAGRKCGSKDSRPSIQIAQFALQNLADVRFRQFRSELDDFRAFVVN